MKLRLEDVMSEMAVKELSPEDEFCVEFKFTINGREVRFQSFPTNKETAFCVGRELMEWASQYRVVRKKVGLSFNALKSILSTVQSVQDEMKKEGL